MTIRLYEYPPSGNCYKVRLLLAHLGIHYERTSFDIAKGETRTPEFRRRFPLGRLPVLELEDGVQLAESNAILFYFAEGTDYLPGDRLARARVLQWMFWEQYSHEPYVAVVRAWIAYFGIPAGKEAELAERTARGYAALDAMEAHLGGADWFGAPRYSIADIALHAYTHVAAEGRFDLSRYPAIGRWIERVRAQPGHVAIDA